MIGAALDFCAGRVWRGVSPSSDTLADIWSAGPTKSGACINHDSALTISAVFRAQEVVSNAIKSLPVFTYDRLEDGSGKRINRDHPAFALLHQSPNPNTTPSRFEKLLAVWAMSWGNGYAEIQIDGAGEPIGLWQIHPSRVTPDTRDGRWIYRVLNDANSETIVDADRMIHVMGFSKDGRRGISVIGHARESLGLTVRAEEYGAQFFGNNARPSVVLEHPGRLKDGGLALRTQWESAFGATGKPHATAVLEDGLKANIIGMPNEDAQFLETRTFQILEVCRWFGVPPHMLMELRDAHYDNMENSVIEFAQYTVLPWVKDFEEEYSRKLLRKDEQGSMFISFMMDGLLRADSKTRNESYEIQRRNGIISGNEWRSKEDMNPIEGEEGDLRIVEANMAPLDSFLPDRFQGGAVVQANRPAPTPTAPPEEDDEEEEEDAESIRRASTSFTPVVMDVVGRMRSVYMTARQRAEKSGKFDADWLTAYRDEHLPKFHVAIAPAVEGLASSVGGCPPEDVFEITKTAGPLYWSYCVDADAPVEDFARMLAENLAASVLERRK